MCFNFICYSRFHIYMINENHLVVKAGRNQILDYKL